MGEVDHSDDMKVSGDEALECQPVLAEWGISKKIIEFKFNGEISEMKFEDFAEWVLGFKLRDFNIESLVETPAAAPAKKERPNKMPPIVVPPTQRPENYKAWASATASTLSRSQELTS